MGFATYCRGGDVGNSLVPGGRGYNGSGYTITGLGAQSLETTSK